jgi:hypothetical protein
MTHISSHEFAPTLGDPGTCGVGNCGEPWSHDLHNPAYNPKWGGGPVQFHVLPEAARPTDEEWGPNPHCPSLNHSQTCPIGCYQIDREVRGMKLGQPKCPVGDCPLTHPHLHPRSEVRPSWVDNPEVVTPPHPFAMKTVKHMMSRSMENADYCANCDCLCDNVDFHPEWRPFRCAWVSQCNDLMFNRPSEYADHALKAHGLDNWQVMEYLQDPWLVGEPRFDWKTRNHGRFYGAAEIKPITTEIKVDGSSLAAALRQAVTPLAGFINHLQEETPVMSDTERMAAELGDWWMDLAKEEVDKVVPKAVEYGALDLIDIGRDLARTAGREVSDEEAAEMGIYFYIRGKLARWTDALVRNDRPSDDTLHDLGVYVRMAQRVRATGAWPGVSDTN